jgi:hypothetical protein
MYDYERLRRRSPIFESGAYINTLSELLSRFSNLKHLRFTVAPDWSLLDRFEAQEKEFLRVHIGDDWRSKLMEHSYIPKDFSIIQHTLIACKKAGVRSKSLGTPYGGNDEWLSWDDLVADITGVVTRDCFKHLKELALTIYGDYQHPWNIQSGEALHPRVER